MDVKYIHTEEVHNTKASEIVVPVILKVFQIDSVLDVGCGIGTWLSVFKANGVKMIKGIDGAYVDLLLLEKRISRTDFVAQDLAEGFDLGLKFDLAISVEVAEHLPPDSAEKFVAALVKHADIIVFGAAVPGQGGHKHLNEQWPSYWASLFKGHGYRAYDVIRPLVWNTPQVDVWYKQNILVYSKNPLNYPEAVLLDIIHPDYFNHRNHRIESLEKLLQKIRSGEAGAGFGLKVLSKSLRSMLFKSSQ